MNEKVKNSEKRKIVCDHGALQKIENTTGFTQPTIRRALSFITKTKKSALIRKMAIEQYNSIIMEEVTNGNT